MVWPPSPSFTTVFLANIIFWISFRLPFTNWKYMWLKRHILNIFSPRSFHHISFIKWKYMWLKNYILNIFSSFGTFLSSIENICDKSIFFSFCHISFIDRKYMWPQHHILNIFSSFVTFLSLIENICDYNMEESCKFFLPKWIINARSAFIFSLMV